MRKFLAASVPVLLLMLAGCTDAAPDLGVLQVPPVGETDAQSLRDGTPVFVVHDLDGTIHVIEANSTHIAEDQMAWCPSSRTLDDVFHGARWDPQGRYVSGPGSTDLGRFELDLADEGSELSVLAYVEPTSRSESPVGVAGPDCVDGGYQVHPFHERD